MVMINQRESILDAVIRVVGKHGLFNTTIDAVASEAGISKGGVLHYFPSKRELLQGMVSLYEKRLGEKRDELQQTLPDLPNRALKATLMVMLRDMEVLTTEVPNLIGVMADADCRRLVGEMKHRIFDQAVGQSLPPRQVATVLYLIDGLYMDLMFSPNVIPADQRKQVQQDIMAMLDAM